jgi:hypothetical protein
VIDELDLPEDVTRAVEVETKSKVDAEVREPVEDEPLADDSLSVLESLRFRLSRHELCHCTCPIGQE